jgi:hypothetical protein
MSTEVSTLDAYVTDWAKLLLTIPQVTDVFHVGTSVWYGSDGQEVVTPNFIVRTPDPYWSTLRGMPHGRAAHALVNEVDMEQARLFNDKWSDTKWYGRHTFGENGTLDTWGFTSDQVRIVEVPSDDNWAGPEYLRRIADGTSGGWSQFQLVLRRLDTATGTLLPAERYWSHSSPVQPV